MSIYISAPAHCMPVGGQINARRFFRVPTPQPLSLRSPCLKLQVREICAENDGADDDNIFGGLPRLAEMISR